MSRGLPRLRSFLYLRIVLACALIGVACTERDAGIGELYLDLPDHVQQRVRQATGVQAEILRNGEVSAADLERAALAARSCMEAAGVEITHFDYFLGGLEIDYVLGPVNAVNDPGDAEAHAVVDTCIEDNFSLVSEVSAWRSGPTEEERQVMDELVLSCAREAGVDIYSIDEALEMLRRFDDAGIAVGDCVDLARDWLRSSRP